MTGFLNPDALQSPVILRIDDPRVEQLLASGWQESARSFGASLDPASIDDGKLRSMAKAVAPISIRALSAGDVAAVLHRRFLRQSGHPARQ